MSLNPELITRYGQPQRVDTAGVLRALGHRAELHPRDAIAFRYASLEAAQAFAEFNREVHGHRVLGPYEIEVGPVSVIDLRPSMSKMGRGCKPTDPTLPDRSK